MEVTLNEGQLKALNILLDWYDDKEPGNELATLEGFAGTGKTFLTKYFIETLGITDVLVSAPTNRAKIVVEQSSGYRGKTVHSILGLQLDLDLAEFNPMNPIFNPKREPDVNYKLIIIDEGSMINASLYNRLKELAGKRKVKMLFMGDRYQLPPIKEEVSKVFTDAPYKATLSEVVRQGKDNPNGKLIMVAIKDIQTGTNLLDAYIDTHSQNINPENLNKSKGFVKVSTTNYNPKDYFIADRKNLITNKSKYIAYTNKNIGNFIDNLRAKVFGFRSFIVLDENLVGYRGISIKRGKLVNTIIVNSEDYTIKDIVPTTLQEGMKGYILYIENLYNGERRYINLVDTTEELTRTIYCDIVCKLNSTAKKLGRVHWVKYYEFVNVHLSFIDVYDFIGGLQTKIKTKDLLYNYGITVHKSQGGTFTNSFVNLSNINRTYKADERKRLKYVALSRCTNVNIIL